MWFYKGVSWEGVALPPLTLLEQGKVNIKTLLLLYLFAV